MNAILSEGARVSVYQTFDDKLERLCRTVDEPRLLLEAFHRLLVPLGDSGTIPLTLPPRRVVPSVKPGLVQPGCGPWKLVSAALRDSATWTGRASPNDGDVFERSRENDGRTAGPG